jgi:uncharacterized protein YecA (UPF0149 family)
MELQWILNNLTTLTPDGFFPRTPLRAAIERRSEITPELLRFLREAKEKLNELPPNFMGHVYALFLLAQFREAQAYPLIIDLLSLPGRTPLDLLGNIIVQNMPSILASVCQGDITPIQQLIENSEINEHVRGAAVRSLAAMVATGQKTREEILDYLQTRVENVTEIERTAFVAYLVAACTDLYPDKLFASIRQLFARKIVDKSLVQFDDVEKVLSLDQEQVLRALPFRYRYVTDTVSMIQNWQCFNLPNKPKPERNDICPCGSGKKFKKCCLQ